MKPNLVVICVALLTLFPARIAHAETPSEAVLLNKDGLAALAKTVYTANTTAGTEKRYREDLTENDWEAIFDKFREALKIDPSFDLARKNLAVAQNDFAICLWYHGKDLASLKQFHQALYVAESDPTIEGNLNIFLPRLGKDPKRFEDRVALGDDAYSNKDYISSVVEYKIALKLKNNSAVHKKLADCYRQMSLLDKAATEDAAATAQTVAVPESQK